MFSYLKKLLKKIARFCGLSKDEVQKGGVCTLEEFMKEKIPVPKGSGEKAYIDLCVKSKKPAMIIKIYCCKFKKEDYRKDLVKYFDELRKEMG